jgi:hypothetical protein
MKTGEYIHLFWDDHGPNPHYIKGHVTLDEAVKTLLPEGVIPENVKHKYGRMVRIGRDHDDRIDGCDSTFRVINAPRKSYYPVTECTTGTTP